MLSTGTPWKIQPQINSIHEQRVEKRSACPHILIVCFLNNCLFYNHGTIGMHAAIVHRPN